MAALDLIKTLIGFDTTSRGSNLALIDFAEELLKTSGARCRRSYDETRAKANLFASFGPETDGGYVLSGHTDVVPVDGQDWSSDPFQPEDPRRQTLRPRRLRHEGLCRRRLVARAGDRARPPQAAGSSGAVVRRGSGLFRRHRAACGSEGGEHQAGLGADRRTDLDAGGRRAQERRGAAHRLPRSRTSFQRAGERRQCRDDGGRIRGAVGRCLERTCAPMPIRVSIRPIPRCRPT